MSRVRVHNFSVSLNGYGTGEGQSLERPFGHAEGRLHDWFFTPVFVLTHHPRPPLVMKGGTTFHFIDATPQEALRQAREAAGGLDVRIGGGPTMVRDFLAADLIDHLHVAVVPILLGRGVRLWEGLEEMEKRFTVESTTTPSGITHVTFTRPADQ